MSFDREKHHRRSIRLKGFDYTRGNVFFVTICSFQKECIFGSISNGAMVLNENGKLVQTAWLETTVKRPGIQLDEFVIMPNHFHGIIQILDLRRGTACRAPKTAINSEQFGRPVSGSLPTIIRSFKSAVGKHVNENRNSPGTPVWQRNYYEHIIRDEDELRRTREYIHCNPENWQSDEEYSQA